LPRRDDGRYDPAEIHKWVVDDLKNKHKQSESRAELDEIARRKKLAEAQRAERELRLADIRIARLEAKLMSVDWVHKMLAEMAAELRKPIEIIGRKHPEYQQMIINGLDNAMDKMEAMFKDDQAA
jgi:predicted RNase H-like nuclease (RuvC/YqgF family)